MSLVLQLSGVILHFITIICITLAVMISTHKANLYERLFCIKSSTNKKKLEIFFFQFGFFHKNSVVYMIGSGLGFLICNLLLD